MCVSRLVFFSSESRVYFDQSDHRVVSSSLMCFVAGFGSSSSLVDYSVSSLHLLLISIMRLTFGYSFSVIHAVVTYGDAPDVSRYVMSTDSMLFLLCCTVRNHAELFRDKTGVVLSGRLSRPPGFVEFTAVCAPVLPLVGTVFVCNFDVALYWVIQLGQPIM